MFVHRALVVLASASMLLASCTRPQRVIVASPAGAQCIQVCRRSNALSWSDQFDCARSCPTARFEEEKSCSAVEKPRCVEGGELNVTKTVLIFVGVVLLGVVLVATNYKKIR